MLGMIFAGVGFAHGNLVVNGGFESPLHTENDGTNPADWLVYESAEGVNTERQVRTRNTKAHSESMGLCLGAGQSNHDGELWQTVPTKAGQIYEFGIWASTTYAGKSNNSLENFRVDLRDGTGTNGTVLATLSSGGTLSTTWQHFSTVVLAPSTHLTIHIRDISTAAAADSNDVILDDVSLEEATCGQVVNVDIDAIAGSTFSGQGGYADPGNDFWNSSLDGMTDLTASDGVTATKIDVTLSAGNRHDAIGIKIPAGESHSNLVGDYSYSRNADTTVTLTGLTASGKYLLYIYCQGDGLSQNALVSFGGTTQSTTGLIDGTIAKGSNYVVAAVTADAAGQVTGTVARNDSIYAAVNGLQLVKLKELHIDVEGNKAEHRAAAIANAWSKDTTQVILAYEGEPLDTVAGGGLDKILDRLAGEDPDFGMISLVRILYLSDRHDNYSYDDLILPALEGFLYWPVQGEPVEYAYWSENHLIMWLSTGYLLKQRQGWEMDHLLEDRLRHWLDLKIEYGFYEWNAPTYWAFTLSALLNLADFAEDADIRNQAETVANRLLEEMLRLTNDRGVFFAVAGRGAYNKISQPFNYFLSPVIHMLTELNDKPTVASIPSGFMATSDVSFEGVSAGWSSTENMSYDFGHGISDSVHAGFPRQDRTFFQWSAGGYFHPDVADDTAYTSTYYDIDEIPELPIILANGGSSLAATFSRSSVLSRASFNTYKNKGVVLSSVEAYYGGYYGYQQYPWMATVDDLAVFTQSGEVLSDWDDRSDDNVNTHLPRVMQDENVALIMYWPNTEISAAFDTDVALHWKDADFDETATYDRWVIGRRNDSYVAVYRNKAGTKNGWYYSTTTASEGGQYWGVVVGNAGTHGSFENFVDIIEASSNADSYTYDFSNFRWEYYARITVDGKELKYTWKD